MEANSGRDHAHAHAHPHTHAAGASCCETIDPLHDSLSLQQVLNNNKHWREDKKRHDKDFFSSRASKQTPRYLWIGCSDSRVPAEEVTGLRPGEMFVHRNVANLVVSNDVSALSVIQFAVEKLKVKDIIVCGHYGCGGVRAAMENNSLGLLDNWLRNIRDVCRAHQPELLPITNEKERFNRIVELNIMEQCLNIFKINLVQQRQLQYGYPRIHGLAYDIHNGELKKLDIDFAGYLRTFKGIYRLHSHGHDELPLTRSQMRRNMVRRLIMGHEEDDQGTVSARFISRKMKEEDELFDAAEVDACIAYALSESTDPNHAFVNLKNLLEFFTDSDSVTSDTE